MLAGTSLNEPGKWVGVTAQQWLEAEEPLAKAGISGADVLAYKEGLRCKFWFVRADKLRTFEGTTPQKLQVLLHDHPDWLELRTVTFSDGIAGMYAQSYLVVSHRWEKPGAPDEMGVQFAETKAHLLANEAIEWVWFECAAHASPFTPLWPPFRHVRAPCLPRLAHAYNLSMPVLARVQLLVNATGRQRAMGARRI